MTTTAPPSPSTLSNQTPATDLPVHLTRFIGRGHELTELARLIGSTRLLTLTGAGGSGKTRLAREVAASESVRLHEAHGDRSRLLLTDGAGHARVLGADATLDAVTAFATGGLPAIDRVGLAEPVPAASVAGLTHSSSPHPTGASMVAAALP